MSNLISSAEASKRLGVSIWTLYRWASLRKVASVRLGKKLLFDPCDLDKLINQNRISEISETEGNI
jgi:excisionase family DNA binding protein